MSWRCRLGWHQWFLKGNYVERICGRCPAHQVEIALDFNGQRGWVNVIDADHASGVLKLFG